MVFADADHAAAALAQCGDEDDGAVDGSLGGPAAVVRGDDSGTLAPGEFAASGGGDLNGEAVASRLLGHVSAVAPAGTTAGGGQHERGHAAITQLVMAFRGRGARSRRGRSVPPRLSCPR